MEVFYLSFRKKYLSLASTILFWKKNIYGNAVIPSKSHSKIGLTHELYLNLAVFGSSPILSPYSLFVSYTGKLRQVSRTNRTFCKLSGVKSLFECAHRLKDFFCKIANSPQLPTVLFGLTFCATTRQTLLQ